MNKRTKTDRIPKLLLAALVVIYLVGVAYLLFGVTFLLSSNESIAEWNYGGEPVNITAAGVILITVGVISLVSGGLIQKKRPYALPIAIILLLPIAGGLLQAADYYSAVQTSPYEYIIYALLDAIFFGYLLFSKSVRSYLEN